MFLNIHLYFRIISHVSYITSMLVCPPLWSTLKYFTNKSWIAMKFGTHVHCAQMMNPTNFSDPLTFLLALLRITFVMSEMSIGWNAVKFGSDINIALRMHFCEILNYCIYLVPSSGQKIQFS